MAGLPAARGLIAAMLAIAAVAEGGAAGGTAAHDGRLSATANGQTIYRIDGRRQAIVAFDPARPEAGRDVVGPAGGVGPEFLEFMAVGCLPGDLVAVVCRVGDAWSLRTYRIEPGRSVDAASPRQEIAIGTASGPAADVDLAVSHARGWLAVTGLPAPLPPVLRAVVGGVRVGPLSDRSCPVPDEGRRPVAAAVSPLDELVLVLGPAGAAADRPEDDELAYYDTAGRELLRLAAGVRGTGGLEFNRTDGTLWAVAADAAGRRGLWRLDAAYVDRHQVVRPVLVSPLDHSRDLVCGSARVVVTHGEPPESVAAIDPVPASPGAEP